MNSAQTVDNLLANWEQQGLSKAGIVWKLAEACLGWSYVFGAVGEICNLANRRKYYNNYSSRNLVEAEQIKKRCQYLSGKKETCDGCPYYPSSPTRCYDCRGFTRWCLSKVGISLQGAGATSQWNNDSNWIQRGKIQDLPPGQLACFFHQNGKTMEHTGFALSGQTIHCSGTVKRGKTTDKGITHYAIPRGLDGNVEPVLPTLRNGSSGEYVTLLQTKLIQMGYDLSPFGADGKYGNKTTAAVKQLQSDHGLVSDGVTGKLTWEVVMSGEQKFYSVSVPHLSKSVAEEIVKKYGGSMKLEGE